MIREKLIIAVLISTLGLASIPTKVESYEMNNIKGIKENFELIHMKLQQNEDKLVDKYNDLYENASNEIDKLNQEKQSLIELNEEQEKYIKELEEELSEIKDNHINKEEVDKNQEKDINTNKE